MIRKLILTGWVLIGALAGLLLAIPLSITVAAVFETGHTGGGDGWSGLVPALAALMISVPILAGLGGEQALKLGRRLNPLPSDEENPVQR